MFHRTASSQTHHHLYTWECNYQLWGFELLSCTLLGKGSAYLLFQSKNIVNDIRMKAGRKSSSGDEQFCCQGMGKEKEGVLSIQLRMHGAIAQDCKIVVGCRLGVVNVLNYN